MTKKFNILLLFLNFIFYSETLNAKISNEIIGNVGSNIITSYELKNKIKTVLFLSGQELNQDNINKAKNNSINSLINYKIKKQEVNKYKIPIEKDENVNLILNNLQKI